MLASSYPLRHQVQPAVAEERQKESLSFCNGKTGWLLRKTEKERAKERWLERHGDWQ